MTAKKQIIPAKVVLVETKIVNDNGDTVIDMSKNYIETTQKGTANGVANLGADGKIPTSLFPFDPWDDKGTFGTAGSTTGGDLPTTADDKDVYTCISIPDYNSVVAGEVYQKNDVARRIGGAWVRFDSVSDVQSVVGLKGVITRQQFYDAFNKVVNLPSTTTQTIDTEDKNVIATITLTANTTITLSNYINPLSVSIEVLQDATGGHTLTILPTGYQAANQGATAQCNIDSRPNIITDVVIDWNKTNLKTRTIKGFTNS